jgi:hypothetical protein
MVAQAIAQVEIVSDVVETLERIAFRQALAGEPAGEFPDGEEARAAAGRWLGGNARSFGEAPSESPACGARRFAAASGVTPRRELRGAGNRRGSRCREMAA